MRNINSPSILIRVLLSSITILALIGSCDTYSSQDSISNPIEVTNSNQVLEAIIDDSDLSLLPIDEGGRQKAYPLGSTSASFGFNLYLPSAYSEDGPEYPLIVFLHGWGGQGDSSLWCTEFGRKPEKSTCLGVSWG